jgi:precorrin-3B synthase
VSADTLGVLSAASARFADGEIQLTSRANLQLRWVATDPSGAVAGELVEELLRAGLLPHPSHERVRNIVCSPLTGLSGGLADLRELTRDIDDKLCSAADLAALPGPFLFALDDGRGDLDALPADLRVRALDRATVQIQVGDAAVGPVVSCGTAADLVIALGRAFLLAAQGEPIWHVRELPQHGLELLSHLDPGVPTRLVRRRAATPDRPLGRFVQQDGRAVLSALVPLGLLDQRQVAAVARAASLGNGQVVITPWRGVLVPDLPFSEAGAAAQWLTAAGLELDGRSPWQGVTACTGAPRCAHGQGETRVLAGRIVRQRPTGTTGGELVHVVGCSRRCGAPSGPHVEVLSGPSSVEITRDGRTMPAQADDASATVWSGR